MGSSSARQWALNFQQWIETRSPVGRCMLILLLAALTFGFISSYISPFSDPSIATAEDDDEEDEEAGEVEEEEFEIPAPPNSLLDVPSGLDPKVRDLYKTADKAWKRAMQAWTKNNRSRALKTLKKVHSRDPELMVAYYKLGKFYAYESRYKDARKILKKGLKKAPECYQLYVQLAEVEFYDGFDTAAAIVHLEKALEIYEWDEDALDNMTFSLISLGKFEEAKPYLEKALKYGESSGRTQCAQAIQFELEGPQWAGTTYQAETDYYLVKSNHSQEICDEIIEEVDLTRELFDKLFPDIGKPERKFLILVFRDRDSYLRGGAPQFSKAYYSTLAKRICMYVSNDRLDMFKTLKHEALHQYLDEHVARAPAWFGEGFAEYYSATELVKHKGKRAISLRPEKVNLESMIRVFQAGAHTPPGELIQMSQYEMYDMANGNRRQGLHYAQAWSMIYFIAEGKNSGYQKSLKKYFKVLAKGKSQEDAWKATFARVDMKKFEEEWIRFIRKLYERDKGI